MMIVEDRGQMMIVEDRGQMTIVEDRTNDGSGRWGANVNDDSGRQDK